MKKEKIEILKTVLSCSVIVILGAAAIVFGLLYMNLTNISFLERHKRLVETLFIIIIGLVTIISVVCQLSDKKFVYRLTFLTLILMTAALAVLYVMQITGLWDKIDSVEDLRNYVSGFGGYAVLIFIAIQFLQVVVLPIPGFITVSVGVLLFGAFRGSVYSVIGIVSASIVAFFIGRVFGYKVAGWLVGKENLDKGLELVKGKDKVILTFMFLFPFFPDDVLCFVAGITTMSPFFFIIMIFITRIISVFASCYSINGSIIPFNTWWGLVLWGIFVAVTVVLAVLIYKKGDKIERWFKARKNIAKKQKNTNKTL